MNKLISSILIATLLLVGHASAYAQKTQQNESDLQFITRINQQATDMYAKANKLDARLAAADQKSDGKKKRNKVRGDLKNIKSQIRDEQNRIDGKDFKKNQPRKEQEQHMKKLQDKLRTAERDTAALVP